ncbi:MAG: glycosyltransferase [Bifidobacteriaceae bacterium]|nr:glycosyltransferase [Bifidobacteriaceae bacterium]
MPHVAYIAWGFPPSRSGGTYRQLATANALAAAGLDTTVITVERRVFTDITGADESLEALVDPRIKVIRTKFAWPLRETDQARWSPLRRLAPGPWRKARVLFESAVFPEVGYAEWRRALRAALRELHREHPIDLVLATANPHVAFAAAHNFHQATGVPFIMDYRDGWSLDVFSGEDQFSARDRRSSLEQRYLKDATQAWFVNSPIRDWYARRYPEAAGRFRKVSNGWDPDLLRLSAAPRPPEKRPLTFGYLGTVSGKVPIAELLEGWRLARADGLVPADAVLKVGGYIGFFNAVADLTRDAAGRQLLSAADDAVEFTGAVPKTEVGAFYESLDVLVLALGAGRYVTSGKVFEYMATGKPIVSVHPPDSAASEVLDGYPLWARVSAVEPADVAQALGEGAQMAARLTPELRDAALAHGAEYTRSRQLGPAIAELKALLDQ